MHVDTITQSDLDGFVSFATIGNAIGAQNGAEKSAALAGLASQSYRVVKAEDISDLREDNADGDARPFLTLSEAVKVLPKRYRPHTHDGVTHPPRVAPKTVVLRGYTASQVAEARAQLSAYRADVEAKTKARAAARRALLERFLAGDADVTLTFTDRAAATPRHIGAEVGASTIGREYSASEVGGLKPAGREFYDDAAGSWVPVED